MLTLEPHHFVYVGGACVWAVEGLKERKSGVTLLLIQAAHETNHFLFFVSLSLLRVVFQLVQQDNASHMGFLLGEVMCLSCALPSAMSSEGAYILKKQKLQ